jgi:hypothetical protein
MTDLAGWWDPAGELDRQSSGAAWSVTAVAVSVVLVSCRVTQECIELNGVRASYRARTVVLDTLI